MKTYFLDVIKRIKRFSEEFNVQTTLCDKTWTVFNDTGEREVYIFQPDGTVFITSNGIGIKGKWHWLSANKSLIINKDDNVMMFHPEFIDNTILALTLDGTNKMAFLIEQGNINAFAAKTLAQLEDYFVIKEKKLIEDEKRRREEEERRKEEEEKRRKEEEEKRRKEEEDKRKKEEEEKRRKEEEDKKRREEEQNREGAKSIKNQLDRSWLFTLPCFILAGFSFLIFLWKRYSIFDWLVNNQGNELEYSEADHTIIFLIVLWGILTIGVMLLGYCLDRRKGKKRIKKWINDHPGDPRNEYFGYEPD